MRVVLVGPPGDRSRVRARLPSGVEVVSEVSTIAAARSTRVEVDGILIATSTPDHVDSADEVSLDPLTRRELDVLALLADGLSNKRIAAELGISDQTVKFHVASICGKLAVANRTEAVRHAIRRGIIPV